MSTQDNERAREQAQAQLDSVKEHVAKLGRESAADLYSHSLTRERCVELLTSIDIECRDDEPTEDLREAVASNITDETLEPDDFEFDEDEARQTIQEDALEVSVRSGWHSPGEDNKPEEYLILLCTGGPAVRIVGDLDEYGQPTRARLEYQDWFTSWQELITTGSDHAAILTYAQQFYFGEG